MKKSITLYLSMIVVAAFTSCSSLFNSAIRTSVNNSTLFAQKITINSIPKTYAEFETLYNELATTPEGTVALELVAMEMYRVNQSVGTRCLKLINTDTNYATMMRRLPEIFNEGDSYGRPYLVASYMQGASPENGYNPDKPYVIQVKHHPNQPTKYYELMEGTVYPMMIYCYGADTPWRPISAFLLDGETYYKIQESGGITSQCKQIKRTQTFNGLD